MNPKNRRVAYILKMYPRFSETFIINEILAHEAAVSDVDIFSLRSPKDGRFHADHARVRAPVTYVPSGMPKAAQLWSLLHAVGRWSAGIWPLLAAHPNLTPNDLYQALYVAQHVRERRPEVLHAHFGSVATTIARLVSKLTGVPYVFTAHAKDIFHDSVDPADLRCKLNDAMAVITVSDYNRAFLQEQFGVADGQITRVYNGMNLDKFRYASPAKRPRRIVGVGRLVEKKGFLDLVEACAILAGRGSAFDCEIIGAGEYEAELRTRIDELGVAEHVRLLGPRPQEEVIQHVQNAAVLAAPCVVGGDGNRDGLPTVLLEAMALGTPCVSTNVTGIPEVIRNGETGLLVDQHNPRELADALESLLDRPTLRVRCAQAARALIEREFDLKTNAKTIRSLYDRTPVEAQAGRLLEAA